VVAIHLLLHWRLQLAADMVVDMAAQAMLAVLEVQAEAVLLLHFQADQELQDKVMLAELVVVLAAVVVVAEQVRLEL
jgi:hypothetical protein